METMNVPAVPSASASKGMILSAVSACETILGIFGCDMTLFQRQPQTISSHDPGIPRNGRHRYHGRGCTRRTHPKKRLIPLDRLPPGMPCRINRSNRTSITQRKACRHSRHRTYHCIMPVSQHWGKTVGGVTMVCCETADLGV